MHCPACADARPKPQLGCCCCAAPDPGGLRKRERGCAGRRCAYLPSGSLHQALAHVAPCPHSASPTLVATPSPGLLALTRMGDEVGGRPHVRWVNVRLQVHKPLPALGRHHLHPAGIHLQRTRRGRGSGGARSASGVALGCAHPSPLRPWALGVGGWKRGTRCRVWRRARNDDVMSRDVAQCMGCGPGDACRQCSASAPRARLWPEEAHCCCFQAWLSAHVCVCVGGGARVPTARVGGLKGRVWAVSHAPGLQPRLDVPPQPWTFP